MNIGLDLYNIAVQIIGPLPIELNFIYGFCTILEFVFVIAFIALPWVIVYKLFN